MPIGTFPLDIDRGTDVELTQYTLKFEFELPGDWSCSNGTRYRESDISRIGLFPNTPVTGQSRLHSMRAGILASRARRDRRAASLRELRRTRCSIPSLRTATA